CRPSLRRVDRFPEHRFFSWIFCGFFSVRAGSLPCSATFRLGVMATKLVALGGDIPALNHRPGAGVVEEKDTRRCSDHPVPLPRCRMAERKASTTFLITFTPEIWPSVTKFRAFAGAPFGSDRELRKGVNSTTNHLAKLTVLAGLANRLKDQLPEDAAEMAEKGHSSA